MRAVKRCLNSAFIITWLLFSYSDVRAQTPDIEKSVIDSFQVILGHIQGQLLPNLNKAEQRILARTKTYIDTAITGNEAYSNSTTKVISISRGLVRTLLQSHIAGIIAAKASGFDRQNFSTVYLELYPILSPGIYPEQAAELNETEIQGLYQKSIDYPIFERIKTDIAFLFLHEFAHQIAHDTRAIETIESRDLSAADRDSLLLALEIRADYFAAKNLVRMNYDLTHTHDDLSLLMGFSEKKKSTLNNYVKRTQFYFTYLYQLHDCDSNRNTAYCQVFESGAEYYHWMSQYYQFLYSPENLSTIRREAFKNKDEGAIARLGKFYLSGTSLQKQDIDSALLCYRLALGNGILGKDSSCNLKPSESVETIESCLFIGGKICELYYRDYRGALEFYQKAASYGRYLSKQYYYRLIARIEKMCLK